MKSIILPMMLMASFIVGAVPAFASDGSSEHSGKAIVHSKKIERKVVKKTVDTACVGTAIDKRETALGGGVSTFGSAVNSAYQTRQSALKDAWSKSTVKDRREAVQAAWKAFNQSVRSARTAWKATQKTAWQSFRSDVKSCGVTSDADTGSQEQEMSL
ncbi:MAG TPA: hypothetical protein VLG69_03120 [Candidatus Andersenbacteria bacterium]|nr:hypothetical protein [Candidatus Andersenbacteria bacterium]